MLISIHLPKTAGTSFGNVLERHFGSGYLSDYADQPMAKPRLEREKVAREHQRTLAASSFVDEPCCIHGHFLPLKYLPLAGDETVSFITWMRDPVQRLISHYYYWQGNYRVAKHHPIQQRMLREQWTLEQFCLAEDMRDWYTSFLRGFPTRRLDFIGIVEHFSAEMEFFCQRYLKSQTYKLPHMRQAAHEKPILDAALQRDIRAFHQQDQVLYEYALKLRQRTRT